MDNTVSPVRRRLENLFQRLGIGMRAKLIALFVVIKVLPLILLASLAWYQTSELGEGLIQRTEEIAGKAKDALRTAGRIAVNDAKEALDARATEDIERMSTDTAQHVADFLYERDENILHAASIKPDPEAYRIYLQQQNRRIIKPGAWELAPDGASWQRLDPPQPSPTIHSSIEENDHSFHYRPPEYYAYEKKPLYLEMTFIDPAGQERVKVTTSPLMDPTLKDVSRRENTFVKAETYFSELKKLKPGEIYVSEVIGEYVGSRVIGIYTPESAAKAGEAFEPEKSAYAGKENPLGKRFRGLVRWATPVEKNGAIAGYVTLALDHDHIMEFTTHLMPTWERYTEISDASAGNYAFIWDYKGRSIVHPRHFSIVGYDAATGDPQVPWLEDRIYNEWQASNLPYAEFIVDVPTFVNQSNARKPSRELVQQGLVGLDCRYLNFAPQCTGWFDLTRDGGSGSFLILWSGLWKLNTAAAIPYYTGRYGASRRGFGFVAIGAGLEDFHSPANATEKVINGIITSTDTELKDIAETTYRGIRDNLLETAYALSISTGAMVILVILIAIWLASAFTRSITGLINGISRFRAGERNFRFHAPIKDEIGALADSFDDMADSLVQSVKGALTITDLEFKILYMNEEGLELIGKSPEDVLGKSYDGNSIFPPNSRSNPLACLLSRREPDVLFHERSGRHYKGLASYLTDKEGRNIGYIIASTDVSDIVHGQRKLEEQRALLDTVFSASPDLLWYKDTRNRYLAVNPRFASAAGKPIEQILGASAADIFPGNPFADTSKDEQALTSQKPFYCEEHLTFADGHSETLDAVRTPLFDLDGTPVGILGVARDVSFRAVAEQELRLTQRELEKAALAANKANESKSAFLARMSHEIRTPMNAIIGMTNIIKRKLTSVPPPLSEVQTHVLQIETSSNHLLGLLNDILDISKIEAGKIELSEDPFDLTKMLASVDSIIRPRCQEKNIVYNVFVEGLEKRGFVSDPLRLRQVLINLLGNSVKFTPECGTVTFRITQEERKEEKSLLRFSITDSGIGISPQAQETLFTPFEQGSSKITQRYGGTGLGLSISRSIVQLLGGDILVHSVEGEGSEFSFSIWLREDETAAEEIASVGNLSALRGKHVLLVDDVEINRVIAMDQLEETGLIVDEAEDGLKAVEAFGASPVGFYDIILMDVQMPNMDGHSAARAIRSLNRPDAATVPIIAMTANAFKEDVEKAFQCGMSGHLAKPLEYDKFMNILFLFLGKIE
ncbi:MAG: PAS domain-containing protein [Desulfovibrio sp.]|jgi:PAS domain S-box-containing protein|nr:PAS domain-containing protein [Desulfovibrio sp.]